MQVEWWELVEMCYRHRWYTARKEFFDHRIPLGTAELVVVVRWGGKSVTATDIDGGP